MRIISGLLVGLGALAALWSYLNDAPLTGLAIPLGVAALGLILGLSWRRKPPARVIIDGSNVLYWAGEQPDLNSVRAVVDQAAAMGLQPVVWFDANAGYLVADRYLNPAAFAQLLRLPLRQVFVAPKGTPADPLILDSATLLGAPVITNDRYRDWQEQYPIARQPDRLIRGLVSNGTARLTPQTPARLVSAAA